MINPSIISPEHFTVFSNQPRQRRDVLITCSEDVERVKFKLEQAGIRIRDEMTELGILHATIRYDDLVNIQDVPGIEWIEIDEEAGVL